MKALCEIKDAAIECAEAVRETMLKDITFRLCVAFSIAWLFFIVIHSQFP